MEEMIIILKVYLMSLNQICQIINFVFHSGDFLNTKIKRLIYLTNAETCDELYHILTLLPGLRFLKINGEGVCRNGIMAINSLRNLKHLKFSMGTAEIFKNLSTQATARIEFHGFEDNYDESLKLFALNNPTVRELVLWSDYGGMVTGSNVLYLASNLKQLKVLEVKTLIYTPGVIRLICKHSKSLEKIKFYLSCKISINDIKFMNGNKQISFEMDYENIRMADWYFCQ